MGINKKLETDREWKIENKCIIAKEIKLRSLWTTVIGLYNKNGIEEIKKDLIDIIEEKRNMNTILIGDWNARIGTIGGNSENSMEQTIRQCKDKNSNREGEKWVEFMNDNDMILLNGNTEGDWQGEYTHDSYKGPSTIDYACCTREIYDKTARFQIENRTEFDHFPIVVAVDCIININAKPKTRTLQIWNTENTAKYKEHLKLQINKRESLEKWSEIKNCIKETMPTKVIHSTGVKKKWFNEECWQLRSQTRYYLKLARKDGKKWEEYRISRKAYKKKIKEQKEEEMNKCRRDLENIKFINDAWKFINKKRASKKRTTKKTDPIMKLKKNKANGQDGIKAEALINGKESLLKDITRILKGCLNGYKIPEEWRESRIWPIHKKEDKRDVQNYRGITIVNVIYKVWALILNSRLTKEVEE